MVVRACNPSTLGGCTPAWVTEEDSISKKKKKKSNCHGNQTIYLSSSYSSLTLLFLTENIFIKLFAISLKSTEYRTNLRHTRFLQGSLK